MGSSVETKDNLENKQSLKENEEMILKVFTCDLPKGSELMVGSGLFLWLAAASYVYERCFLSIVNISDTNLLSWELEFK